MSTILPGLFRPPDFDPLALAPILAFTAESSMKAPLAAQTLDLDPSNPSSLSIVTATRAGVATYVDSAGDFQTAAENSVRVDHVDGVPMILVEPSATNLLINTDFSNWFHHTTTTLEDGSGYGGQGSKIFTASAHEQGKYFNSPYFEIVPGTSYTGSIYLKRSSGSGSIHLYYQYRGERISGGGNLIDITNEVGEQWTRVETTFTPHARVEDIFFGVWVDLENDSVEVAAPQVEDLTVATSFIPTSGSAVTRAADELVIDGSEFTNFYSTSGGTFYAEIIDRTPEIASAYIVGQTPNQFYLYSNSGNGTLYSFDGSNLQSLSSVTENELFRAAATYNSSEKSISLNGATGSSSTHNGNFGSANVLKIGKGYTNTFNGHFGRIIFWPQHAENL